MTAFESSAGSTEVWVRSFQYLQSDYPLQSAYSLDKAYYVVKHSLKSLITSEILLILREVLNFTVSSLNSLQLILLSQF
jgi:hypothetical protein